jgi:Zn-dependent peptidase ImmA (M78 family)
LLQTLAEKEKASREMEQDLERYRECDPEVLEDLKKETGVAKEATTRWTDNVFSVKHWCKSKFSIEEKQIDKVFGIPEDFDYVDL